MERHARSPVRRRPQCDRRRRRLRSSASSPAARPSMASTPASACSPRPAIPADRLADLQRNLILSHCCGLGDPLPRHVTRLMIVLKLIGLGRGHSGVRREVIDALQCAARRRRHAAHPGPGQRRRVGRSCPAGAYGRGADGRRADRPRRQCPARRRRARRQWAATRSMLAPKEGLALINGTQASTAIALDALFLGTRVFDAALHAGALSVDALKGSCAPFDARIHLARGQPGQIARRRPPSRHARRQRRSRPATTIATGCRIPTASAASRRSWAQRSTS